MRKIARVIQTSDYCRTGKCAYIVMYDNFDREVFEEWEQLPQGVKDFLIVKTVRKKVRAVVVYM